MARLPETYWRTPTIQRRRNIPEPAAGFDLAGHGVGVGGALGPEGQQRRFGVAGVEGLVGALLGAERFEVHDIPFRFF